MTERIKIKSWWSDDKKWFCILVDDGVNQSTVSLTPEETAALSLKANPQTDAAAQGECQGQTRRQIESSRVAESVPRSDPSKEV